MKFFASKQIQRVANFSLALMLVVSTISASVPFLFSEKASAVPNDTVTAQSTCVDNKAVVTVTGNNNNAFTLWAQARAAGASSTVFEVAAGTQNLQLRVSTNLTSIPAGLAYGDVWLSSDTSGSAQFSYDATYDAIDCSAPVATNATTGVNYTTLQAAFDAATAGQTVKLTANIEIPSVAAVIRTAGITFDGQNFTIKTTSPRGNPGEQKNAALIVEKNDVTVKNVVVEGTTGTGSSHGLIVFGAQNVTLSQITAKNNAAGIVVNASLVNASGITTTGNNWYGINVDKGNARLNISGTNTHSEAEAIVIDNDQLATVNDVEGKYTEAITAPKRVYNADTTAPVANFNQVQPPTVVSGTFPTRLVTYNEPGTFLLNKTIYYDVEGGAICRTYNSTHRNLDATCDAATLSEGTHKLVGVVVDPAGNKVVVDSRSFIVDHTGPTVTVKAESTGSTGDKIFKNVSFKLYDANQVDKITINGVVKELTNNNYSDANGVTVGVFGAVEGPNTLVAYDVAGNTTTYTFTVDTTNPNLSFEKPSLSTYAAGDSLKVTATDNIAIDKVTYQIIGTTKSATVTVSGIAQTAELSRTISQLGLGDGIYLVKASVSDKAGNYKVLQGYTIIVDRTAPIVVNIRGIDEGEFVNRAVTTRFDVLDGSAMSYTYKIERNAQQVATGTGSFGAGLRTATLPEVSAAGTYKVTFTVKDSVGNEVTVVRNFTIDKTAPTATIQFPVVGVTGTSFKVQYSEAVRANDAKNPANYFLNNWPGAGGSGNLVGDAVITYDPTTYVATVSFLSSAWYVSGEQQWAVKNVRDLAGNAIADTTAYSSIMTPPTAPGTPVATTPTNALTSVWTWGAATDPGTNPSGVKGYEYALTAVDGTPANGDWTYTTALTTETTVTAEGSYTLHVRALDNAGNTGDVATGNVVVDTTPPEVTITSATSTGNTPTITGTAELGAVLSVTFNGVTSAIVNNDGAWSFTSPTALSNGTYAFAITATDEANNVTTGNTNVVVAVAAPAAAQTFTVTPATISPAANQGVLGESTDDQAAQSGAADVAGTSDDKSADSEANKGTIFGIAWYWWILILAALAALAWFIIGAIRRRNEEQA